MTKLILTMVGVLIVLGFILWMILFFPKNNNVGAWCDCYYPSPSPSASVSPSPSINPCEIEDDNCVEASPSPSVEPSPTQVTSDGGPGNGPPSPQVIGVDCRVNDCSTHLIIPAGAPETGRAEY